MRGWRSPGTAALRRRLAAEAESERTGVPADELLGRLAEDRALLADDGSPSRRRLLAGAGATGLAAAAQLAVGAPRAAAAKATAPRIAIVGGGLSGLRAAHWLWNVKGLRATVHEANPDRLGGRMWSLRGWFDAGQVVEHGGAFINTDHNALRNLVNSLGLGLYEVAGGNQTHGDVYWSDGIYTYAEASDDWAEVWKVFKDTLATAPYPQTRAANTEAGVALDHMTVDEWIDANIPGGTGGRFGSIMRSNSIAEYGLDPWEQSALNLVYLLGGTARTASTPSTAPTSGSPWRGATTRSSPGWPPSSLRARCGWMTPWWPPGATPTGRPRSASAPAGRSPTSSPTG